jgi:hypothetical protein
MKISERSRQLARPIGIGVGILLFLIGFIAAVYMLHMITGVRVAYDYRHCCPAIS